MYAGYDPLTGQRHYLNETVPAGPKAWAEAERVRTRMLSEVDENRNPRTGATVDQLMDRYLEVLDVEDSTRRTYVGYIKNHIRPALGEMAVARLDGELLDTFYAQLRTCRARCAGTARPGSARPAGPPSGRGRPSATSLVIDHRTSKAHECDHRCRPHACRPLSAATVRQIHHILSGALDRAVRWRWIATSPIDAAEPPSQPKPNPTPPSPEETARIIEAAQAQDDAWGTMLWLVVVTGVRRGEVCALRRSYLDLERATLRVPVNLSDVGLREKLTKTHQQRRIALDSATVELLKAHLERVDTDLANLELPPDPEAFLFSPAPDHSRPWHPDSVSHRYKRMVTALGINTSLHKLRHYNATQLVAAGVDLRTVAGRLGHAGGGTTTLRAYSAWVSEADERAARTISESLRPTVEQ